MDNETKIAVIGGTGALGSGLAHRWAKAGFPVVIGSRDTERAAVAAMALNGRLEALGIEGRVAGDTFEAATATADVVIIAVPFAAHAGALEAIRPQLRGQIVIDVTVPLQPPRVGMVQLPPEGCVAVQTQVALGESARIVSAFQNVSAVSLQGDEPIDCDVLVCSDDKEAATLVVALAERAGMRAILAGPLANSAATEAMTSLLITINRAHKIHAGLRITGLPASP